MDNYEERLRGFIEREQTDAALQFLRGLEEKGRKQFATFLKGICKEYLELRDTSKGWRMKENEKQVLLINCLLFVCSPRDEFERRVYIQPETRKRIDEILPWHRPSWFSDYINSLGSEGFIPNGLTYDWILELAAGNYIVPSREIIARTLARHIFEEVSTRNWIAKRQKVFDYEVTLREHIWYFFNTENFIYQADREDQWGSRSETNRVVWSNLFLELTNSGKIDRLKLLSESILGTSRNFNKPLTSWLTDLFISLEATKDELLQIQYSLFNALNSNHSKAVNTALSCLKKIADDKSFDAKRFIEYVPSLLSSDTKAIVSSTLSVIDKVAKKDKGRRIALCVATCQAFIHADADLQTKAASLIAKYYEGDSDEFRSTLLQYEHSILANARKILTALPTMQVSSFSVIEHSLSAATETQTRAPLHAIRSFDELMFLASQAFDYNQTYHIDLLPAALVEWHHKIKPEQVPMFEPALQRALKIAFEGVDSTGGSLEYLLCLFFIDYCRTLTAQQPIHAQSLAELYAIHSKKDIAVGGVKGKRIIPLKDWRAGREGKAFNPIIDILLAAHEKTMINDRLPLLSTPTHEPCFISPEVLIARLKQYNDTGREPNHVDFQVAASRCDLTKGVDFIFSAKESLSGELRKLVMFLLDPSDKSTEPSKYHAVWIAASLSKDNTTWPEQFNELTKYKSNKFIAQDPWRVFLEPYQEYQFNDKTRKPEKVTVMRKRLEIQFDRRYIPQREGKFKELFTRLAGSAAARKGYPTIYDTIQINYGHDWVDRHDIARLIYLTPNNPEPLFAEVLNATLREPTFDSSQLQILSSTLEAILPLDFTYRKMGHLLIAASMLTGDKTVQTFAAELWARGVSNGKLNSAEIGACIGEMQSIEFAPLKRFTDLISSNMINLSSYHNKELEKILIEVISRLPSAPVTNLKKLLEVYYEIVIANGTKVPENILPQLKAWESSSGLKKIIALLRS
jgi:hypothetical protein